MKKFISISPFQKPEYMENGIIYDPENNPDLKYSETSFPIIPVLNAYAEHNDKIEIITVIADYDYAIHNYNLLKKEIKKVSEKNEFEYTLKEVNIPYSDDIDSQLEMFGKLIEMTADEDTIYADITFGSKVMTQVLNMSINYGYRINQNVSLGCIVYGKLDHTTNSGKLYDQTSMNYMDEIVRLLAENKVKNPVDKIKRMLK